MKTLLTIIFLFLITLSVNGQQKHQKSRYFKCEIEYTIDCGSGTSTMETTWERGISPSYDELYLCFKKWVYPHKVKEFSIVRLKETIKSELFRQSSKFECPITNIDTVKLSVVSTPNLVSSFHYYDVVYFGAGNHLLIVEKNSDSLRTVTFSKSKVHFINDSTFTFKIK